MYQNQGYKFDQAIPNIPEVVYIQIQSSLCLWAQLLDIHVIIKGGKDHKDRDEITLFI